mgnify:CR=1 FL=1
MNHCKGDCENFDPCACCLGRCSCNVPGEIKARMLAKLKALKEHATINLARDIFVRVAATEKFALDLETDAVARMLADYAFRCAEAFEERASQ